MSLPSLLPFTSSLKSPSVAIKLSTSSSLFDIKFDILYINRSIFLSMAKVGKLTKLKSAIKRWPSFTKQLSFSSSRVAIAATAPESSLLDNESKELHVVYVGKSRRRYFLSSDVIFHPLFQELVERSAAGGGSDEDGGGEVVVACEVVLFEHLVWMINESATAGGGRAQLGSMQELVEFYTC